MKVCNMKKRQDPSAKPYYKCFSCPDFRKSCGGMPTREMDLKNWCEYIRDVMDLAHLTNAYVAKEADVSLKTMERISAGNDEQDIMRATARRVEMVVLGSVGNHTCRFDLGGTVPMDEVRQLRAEVDYWRRENDRKARIIDRYLND